MSLLLWIAARTVDECQADIAALKTRDESSGIREFVVGTGGAPPVNPMTSPRVANSVVDSEKSPGVTAYGVLRLRLSTGTYAWEVPPSGGGDLHRLWYRPVPLEQFAKRFEPPCKLVSISTFWFRSWSNARFAVGRYLCENRFSTGLLAGRSSGEIREAGHGRARRRVERTVDLVVVLVDLRPVRIGLGDLLSQFHHGNSFVHAGVGA
jgi:hypothetical protein